MKFSNDTFYFNNIFCLHCFLKTDAFLDSSVLQKMHERILVFRKKLL